MPTSDTSRPDLVVRGAAEQRVMPDRAVIMASVHADGTTREEAYTDAAHLTAAVDAVLSQAGDDIDRVITAALLVQPRSRWHKGEEKQVGWRATRRTTIELAGFEHLGRLLADLTAAGAALQGPYWAVDPANAAHAEVRRAAAADARARAEAYAAGLGCGLGPVQWIAEPGLGRRGGGGGHEAPVFARAAMASPRAMAAEMDEVIDVSPEEMTIAAQVEVAFALDVP